MLWVQILAAVLLVSGSALLLGFLRWMEMQEDAPPPATQAAVVPARPQVASPADHDWMGKAA